MSERHDDTNKDDRLLDDAIEAARAQVPDEAASKAARERVWARLSQEAKQAPVSACSTFLSQLDDHVAGSLAEGAQTLQDAHSQECLPCRRALTESRREAAGMSAAPVKSRAVAPQESSTRWGFRLAVAATVLLGVFGLSQLLGPGAGVDTPGAVLAELNGQVISLDSARKGELTPGMSLNPGEVIKTAKGSFAVLTLADGSRVEVNERSELSVTENGDALSVSLRRGDIIVEAAKRKTRSLSVDTSDFSVAVKGTVFAVGHGLKGSRVAVLEGSVQVNAGGKEQPLLQPGQQLSTRDQLTSVAVADHVGWSQNADRYAGLLAELQAVEASLAKKPFEHRVRYSSSLLDGMPEGTVLYAAIPNLPGNLDRFVELLTERIEASPELAAWWHDELQRQGQDSNGPSFEDVMTTLRDVSSSLGDEIVMAVALADGHGEPVPVFVAELKDEGLLQSTVDRTLSQGLTHQGGQLLDRAQLQDMALAGQFSDPVVASIEGHLVLSPSPAFMLRLADSLSSKSGGGVDGGFGRTNFGRSLSAQYEQGAEWLFAADLEALIDAAEDEAATRGHARDLQEQVRAFGMNNLEHFIFTAGQDNEGSAVLSFREQRDGLQSWLAEPGPMGSLDFISPEATFVAAAVVKDPLAMLQDIESLSDSVEFLEGLARFRTETGVDLYTDVAAPLGGEVAFALDGPLLPMPSWKLVLEVYDPDRLQLTIERLVERANDWIRQEPGMNGELVELRRHEGQDVGMYSVVHPALPQDLFYSFRDGYLVLASSRFGLERAMQGQRLGTSLGSVGVFPQLLPRDGGEHFSMLVYQDFGPMIGPLFGALSSGMNVDPQALAQLGGGKTASLVHARAEDRRITVGTNSTGPGPGATLAALLRQALVTSLQETAERGLLDRQQSDTRHQVGAEPQRRERSY